MNNPLTSPRLRKAANVLGIVLLIAIVAPFAVYAAPEIVGADESFVVLTPSMTPEIAPGDVVIVAERDPTAIVEGDVITFARGASDVPVTHRVIDVVDEGGGLAFETQGDANEGPDPGSSPRSEPRRRGDVDDPVHRIRDSVRRHANRLRHAGAAPVWSARNHRDLVGRPGSRRTRGVDRGGCRVNRRLVR